MTQKRNRRHIWLIAIVALVLSILACGAVTDGAADTSEPDDTTTTDGSAEQPTEAPQEEPTVPPEPAEPTATPAPTETPTPEPVEVRLLLVSEDAFSGNTSFTSADEISNSLDALGIQYDRQATKDGYPTAGQMAEYTGVIWSVGDDCCDSPGRQSAEAMDEYVRAGGNLLIEGGSIANSWTVQPALSEYQSIIRARRTGFTPMGDMVVATEHPITVGFDSSPIRFQVSSFVDPDVIEVAGDAIVLFERGPNSAGQGTPAMIAYETENTKVVYSTAPLQWMSSAVREQLLQNITDWFSG